MRPRELDGQPKDGLTIFAIPKPFRDHIAVIQRNAIQSWTLLGSSVEVVLLGGEEGTAEVALELGVRHEREVARNEYGTPYVHDVFARAKQLARHDLLAYVNADIILMSDWMAAVETVAADRACFLLVGQRWDVKLDHPWRFEGEWEKELCQYVRERGKPHGATGIDFFVFPRDLVFEMPPLLVGRLGWDNWMLYEARRRGVPVIDASTAAMPVHQDHGYHHVPHRRGRKYLGPEGDYNASLLHPYNYLFTIQAADWILQGSQVRRAVTVEHIRQLANAWFSFRFPKLRHRLRLLLGPRVSRMDGEGTP